MLLKDVNKHIFILLGMLFSIIIASTLLFLYEIRINEYNNKIKHISTGLQEIEINIFELGHSISQYVLYNISKKNLARIKDSQEDALRYLNSLMNDDFVTEIGIRSPLYQIKYNIEEFIVVSEKLQDVMDKKHTNYELVKQYINKIDFLLDIKLTRFNNLNSKKIKLILKLERDLAKLTRELGIYLKSTSSENITKIQQLKKNIAKYIDELNKDNNSKNFSNWLSRVKRAEKFKYLFINKVIEFHDTKIQLLKELHKNLDIVDYQLDSVIENIMYDISYKQRKEIQKLHILNYVVLGFVFLFLLYLFKFIKIFYDLSKDVEYVYTSLSKHEFDSNYKLSIKNHLMHRLHNKFNKLNETIKKQYKLIENLKIRVNALGKVHFTMNFRNQIIQGSQYFYNIFGYKSKKICAKNIFFSSINFSLINELLDKDILNNIFMTINTSKNIPYYMLINTFKLSSNEVLFYSNKGSFDKNKIEKNFFDGYIILDLKFSIIDINVIVEMEFELNKIEILGKELSSTSIELSTKDIKNLAHHGDYKQISTKNSQVFYIFVYAFKKQENSLNRYFVKFKRHF